LPKIRQRKKGLITMFARFLSGTPLYEVEIEMQLIPSFTPRACGTYRSQLKSIINKIFKLLKSSYLDTKKIYIYDIMFLEV